MTKKTVIMIVALIALVLLMIAPVFAYSNQLVQWTASGTHGDGSVWPSKLQLANISSAQNIDVITWSGTCIDDNTSTPKTGSITLDWYNGGDLIVPGTLDWDKNACSLVLTLGGWDLHGLTGGQTLTGSSQINWIGQYVYFGSGGINTSDYSGAVLVTDTHPINGIWTSYGSQVGSHYNLTVIVGVVGGGNYSVSGALVEIHLHDAYDTIISGDTDINGTIVFEGVDITAAPECRIFATGYQYWGEFFAPTGDTTIIANLVWMTTPTTAPTIVPGYIRTEIATIDIYGARIYGTTINILDVEAGVWKNSTNDVDGLLYIDTLPYHTLNVYGSYDLIADQYLDAQLIGISTGYDGGIRFYLVMYPADIDPGLGNVNLYVTVLDNNGLVPIPTALVKVGIPGNPTLSGYTSSSGVQRFVVPNQTVLHITAEKSGYQTGGTIINSGTGVTADAIIALDRITVTPTTTGYIPTGGITPIVTFDSRTANQKDTDMMEIIRNAGPDLINLAIAATVIGLLGLMMKGLK